MRTPRTACRFGPIFQGAAGCARRLRAVVVVTLGLLLLGGVLAAAVPDAALAAPAAFHAPAPAEQRAELPTVAACVPHLTCSLQSAGGLPAPLDSGDLGWRPDADAGRAPDRATGPPLRPPIAAATHGPRASVTG